MTISRRNVLKVALALALSPLSAQAAPGAKRVEYTGADDPQAFRDFLQDQSQDAVVICVFHADWCGPCKHLFKQLDEIAQQPGVKFKLVGVDVGPPRMDASPYKNILHANKVFGTPATEIMATGIIQFRMKGTIEKVPEMTRYLRDLTRTVDAALRGEVVAPVTAPRL